MQDSNSTNGTFIEGQRLSPSSPHQVKATTEVRLGMGDDRDPPVRLTIDVNERVGRDQRSRTLPCRCDKGSQ